MLPPEQFPQFASEAAGGYEGAAGGAFDPVEGDWYAGARPRQRLVHAAGPDHRPDRGDGGAGTALQAQLSFDTEPDYDHVIVEAHTVGSDDWTTLPEIGGLTSTDVPADCEPGFLLEEHPFLLSTT